MFLSDQLGTMHFVTKTIRSTRFVLGLHNLSTTRNLSFGIISNSRIKAQIPKERLHISILQRLLLVKNTTFMSIWNKKIFDIRKY